MLDITVLDLTRLLPGATATQYFADHGANVIKLEQPGIGDYARSMDSELFRATNAGKKSVTIDLKKAGGCNLLLRLAESADVLIESFRPGVMARLGIDYEALSRRNPRLIYASLTGYGQSGPHAMLAGHDINYLALGGVLGLNLPVIPGVQIADIAGGAMQAVIEILRALLERNATGQGCYLDISMLAGVQRLLTIPLTAWRSSGREPEAGRELLSGKYACYNLYQANDGRWLAVGALEPKFWAELCRCIGCEDLVDLQFAGGDDQLRVKEFVAAIFRTRTAAEWFELLRDTDCCVTPVLKVSEVAATLPAQHRMAAPALGEHTRSVLAGHGISDAELEALACDGVI
jgi:crotonobetainyl-CoA:carnitine CoA-transferase CaiB-like acyl-CoA transferase